MPLDRATECARRDDQFRAAAGIEADAQPHMYTDDCLLLDRLIIHRMLLTIERSMITDITAEVIKNTIYGSSASVERLLLSDFSSLIDLRRV